MPSWRHALSALAVLAALLIAGPAAALAQSAGNQQYIDPLAGNGSQGPTTSTGSSSHHHTSSGSGQSSSGQSSSGATSGSSASSPSSSSQGTSTTSSTSPSTASSTSQGGAASAQSSSSGTLPRTGLDLAPCLAAACALLGAGLALRRITRPD